MMMMLVIILMIIIIITKCTALVERKPPPTIDYALCIISKYILPSFPQLICFKNFDLEQTFKIKVKSQGQDHIWCGFS